VVVLRFNEPVSPLAVSILGPAGETLPEVRTEVVGNELHVGFPYAQEPGTYAVSWRVVSTDGHPIRGTLIFSVGTRTSSGVSGDNLSSDTPHSIFIWLTRCLVYLGIFVGVAGLVYAKPREEASSGGFIALVGVALAALALSVALLGLDVLGRPFEVLLDRTVWHAALSTSYGYTASLLAVGLGVGLMAWFSRAGQIRVAFGSLAILLFATGIASSGHAGSAPPAWLARPTVWLHAAGIALWVGAFLPLLRELKVGSQAVVALPRFSCIAPMVVAVVLLSGVTLAFLQLSSPADLWRTAYGRLLGIKIMLVAALLVLGAYNRFRLTIPAHNGNAAAQLKMRRSVSIELILAIIILAIAAAWRFTPPPRSLHAQEVVPAPAAPMKTRIQSSASVVELAWSPGDAQAPGAVVIQLSQPDHSPLLAQEVTVAFSSHDAGIEPITFHAVATQDNTWRVDEVQLPAIARWEVRVEVLISDFHRIVLESTLGEER
jgi:copper transport protein